MYEDHLSDGHMIITGCVQATCGSLLLLLSFSYFSFHEPLMQIRAEVCVNISYHGWMIHAHTQTCVSTPHSLCTLTCTSNELCWLPDAEKFTVSIKV